MKALLTCALLVFCLQASLSQSFQSPCAKQGPYHVVVLGSSTAAGAGASVSDSAWVNRFRVFLQELNPGNQVTNLAVGGYHTYRIMPNSFVPPPNRPSQDTLRNITSAIALNPDAIILNLPSNDVALGYTLAEQTFNMDSIFATAQQAGIPIWICTTQPRNFNPTNLQLQAQMRDTILAHFSPFVIDFWTGIALSNNALDPFYDSGDGVHLNDLGHKLLFERARGVNIPVFLYQPVAGVDLTITELINENDHPCGDSSTVFKAYWSSIGQSSPNDTFSVHFEVHKVSTGLIFQDSVLLNAVPVNCELDSIVFQWNSSVKGDYEIITYTDHNLDAFGNNDSISLNLNSLGRPVISTIGDTLCEPGIGELNGIIESEDTLVWYASANAANTIGGGNLSIPGISSDTVFYAQAVRGPLFFMESLFTTSTSNINWNGTMFDLIASDTLILDSLAMKIADPGTQIVEMRTKTGSFLGFEQNSSPWSIWSIDTVQVSTTEDFQNIHFNPIQLFPGDTLGVYLQMSNPSSRLSYHSIPNPVTRTEGPLSIKTGSGISHNFSGTFFPRDWNGEVFFHYGYRAEGECATTRLATEIEFSDQELFLGFQDTIIGTGEQVILFVPTGFTQPVWSDGSTGNSITLSANTLGQGIHPISLSAFDSLNCLKYDTVSIEVNLTGLNLEPDDSKISIYPNPGNDLIHIESAEAIEHIEIRNSLGHLILDLRGSALKRVETGDFKPGMYFVSFSSPGLASTIKWIKK